MKLQEVIDHVRNEYKSDLTKQIAEKLVLLGAEEPIVSKLYYANEPKERYICEYSLTNMTSEYDNHVDACVAMIENLHELKML